MGGMRCFVAMAFVGLLGCARGDVDRSPPAHGGEVVAGSETAGPAPVEAASGEPDEDADGDGDGDNIPDVCDRCPDEMETYNGALDLDGCPDRSGLTHALGNHATRRFGLPIIYAEFAQGSATPHARGEASLPRFVDQISDRSPRTHLVGVEAGACVGRREPGEARGLSRARADAFCALLAARGFPPELLVIRDAGTHPARVDEAIGGPLYYPVVPHGAGWFVTRGDGVDVWRWAGDHLERATPRAELEYDPPLAEHCR